ncbi:MAG: MBL fold metallo-hydrolase [Candidatus Auribacterota bacterium]|jgi:phosphoribosyl 1,2-cyclic phosphate phosphodiesterase|nr:MBL fold metallo-hydrolase [Candidatus Auribacterota bacterium]
MMNIRFLGTGTSYGVPVLACSCPVCTSQSPRNKRLRCSVAVRYDDRTILIDTPPDLRTQLLNNNISRINAILFTHYHADHILGLDDVRIINQIQKAPIPCYALPHTIDTIRSIFGYAFDPSTPVGGGLPKLTLHTIEGSIDGKFEMFDKQITPVPIMHGTLPITGFKWDSFAYITDCSFMPQESVAVLKNIPVLVINGLRYRPHSTHYSIGEALEIIGQINPGQAYITHISHDIDYHDVKIDLPDNVHIAYDGLELEISG